jgi:hypothetical protein
MSLFRFWGSLKDLGDLGSLSETQFPPPVRWALTSGSCWYLSETACFKTSFPLCLSLWIQVHFHCAPGYDGHCPWG